MMHLSADRDNAFHSFHLIMTNADAEMQYAACSINFLFRDFILHHLQYELEINKPGVSCNMQILFDCY